MLAAFELHEPDRRRWSRLSSVYSTSGACAGVSPSSWIACWTAVSAASSTRSTAIDACASRPNPAAGYAATVEPIDKDITIDAVEGRIPRDTPSLTQALDEVGERIDLALQMADIFSGELDFSSELQPGDSFRLVVERQTREGAFVGYGAILAAEFVASGGRSSLPLCNGRRQGGLLRRGRPLAEALLPQVPAEVRAAHHLAILGVPPSSDPGLRPRPQRRRLPGAHGRAGRVGGPGRGDVRGMDGRRRPHRSGAPHQRLRERISAPLIHRRARRRARSQGELVGQVGATVSPPHRTCITGCGATAPCEPVVEHRNMPPGEPIPAAELAAYTEVRLRLIDLVQPTAARAAH